MNSASLSLFSTGATRGFIIEVGHGITTTVPVFEVTIHYFFLITIGLYIETCNAY